MHIPASTRIRVPTSTCSECRRRHQKCISRGEGPCLNCMRRYPPVVCDSYIPTSSQSKSSKRKYASRIREHVVVDIGATPLVVDNATLVKTESPKPFGGLLSAINATNGIAVKPTPRNTELFQFFLDCVVARLSSIDGRVAPATYKQSRIPWMIQSPLMPSIAILLASFAEGMERGLDVNRCQETLALKVKALALTNEFLTEDFSVIGNDAMLAIIHLASLEYVWGHEQSLLSHLRGLKEMVRLKGGFAGLTDRITGWVIIMLDFEVAIRYERELYIIPLELVALMSRASSTVVPAPAFLSPLQSAAGAFATNQETLSHSISEVTAEILDDISFLISTITSSPPSPTSKIRGTASWLHSRLLDVDVKPKTDSQIILCVIKLIAISYTNSISTLTPLSLAFEPKSLAELYSYFNYFQPSSMKRWGAIPGVFLWVLLVAGPAAGDDHSGRYLRSKMAATRIVLGLENYNLPFAYLSNFWKVQRWIAKEREMKEQN